MSASFPRNFHKAYPQAVRGKGCYIYTADGRGFLDAAGGAAVVTIGHGVGEIAEAMAEQARRMAYVHSSQFHTEAAEELAASLLQLAPEKFRKGGRVYFTSGGSEATETALKLARQYFLERGQAQRFRIVARRQSYHGSTLGALSVSGNVRRREPFAPLLSDWGHIDPCYCYRCPLGLSYPSCDVACASELGTLLDTQDGHDIAAFILEPVSGATLAAAVPPEGYAQRISDICRRCGILLIADEVMSGMGRTGRTFAFEHWNLEPDIILLGKGVASGYAPLGAVLVSGEIAEAIAKGSGVFLHGFTYNAHPVCVAAGLAVVRYGRKHGLTQRVAPLGTELMERLRGALTESAVVGDIRGLGLLVGIEFVRDKGTREAFPVASGIAGKIAEEALGCGVVTYPIQGCADGYRGDHLLLAPPFVINSEEIGILVAALHKAIGKVAATAGSNPPRAWKTAESEARASEGKRD